MFNIPDLKPILLRHDVKEMILNALRKEPKCKESEEGDESQGE
jgi:hypothetical protein